MTNYEILFAIVSGDVGVAALIGAGADCKFFPAANISQDTPMPAAAYRLAIGVPENVMDGAPVGDGLRWQIDAFANDDHDAAVALADAIELALQNRDAMIEHGIGIRCISQNGSDYDPDLKRYRDSRDYSFRSPR